MPSPLSSCISSAPKGAGANCKPLSASSPYPKAGPAPLGAWACSAPKGAGACSAPEGAGAFGGLTSHWEAGRPPATSSWQCAPQFRAGVLNLSLSTSGPLLHQSPWVLKVLWTPRGAQWIRPSPFSSKVVDTFLLVDRHYAMSLFSCLPFQDFRNLLANLAVLVGHPASCIFEAGSLDSLCTLGLRDQRLVDVCYSACELAHLLELI